MAEQAAAASHYFALAKQGIARVATDPAGAGRWVLLTKLAALISFRACAPRPITCTIVRCTRGSRISSERMRVGSERNMLPGARMTSRRLPTSPRSGWSHSR